MYVFVTGSTGFIGTAVVKELLQAGATVLGLTRSEKGIQQLESLGAKALRGTLEDLDILKQGASECDAVIHLAFVHDFQDYPKACELDRDAIAAMGSALALNPSKHKAMVVTSGTMMLSLGKVGLEDDSYDLDRPMAATRGASERVALDLAKLGVCISVVRLPPTTHGPGSSGLMSMLVGTALQKGISAYVGDGQTRWSACHRDDAAAVYRLAMEKAITGSVFHAVAEEGITMKDIATEVGKQLDIPIVSLEGDAAAEHFGWIQPFVTADNPAASDKTKEQLGWTPKGVTVLEDVPVIVDYLKSMQGAMPF